MAAAYSTSDPNFRTAVADTLRHQAELLVCYAWTHLGGAKDWFLIQSLEQFDIVLRRGANPNDRVDVYLRPQLPLRGITGDPQLLDRALAILKTSGEVLLATLTPGDPELHHASAYDEADDVRDWFQDLPKGQRAVIGPHPSLDWDDPAASLLAYVPQPDGQITPHKGAY